MCYCATRPSLPTRPLLYVLILGGRDISFVSRALASAATLRCSHQQKISATSSIFPKYTSHGGSTSSPAITFFLCGPCPLWPHTPPRGLRGTSCWLECGGRLLGSFVDVSAMHATSVLRGLGSLHPKGPLPLGVCARVSPSLVAAYTSRRRQPWF